MEKELKSLPSDTVRLIGSSQVITSVFSVVKELLENALDAGATTIDVKLENYGLDKIEVRDNGHGIKQCNIPFVAKRYHTSKISSFNDLELLTTYGFRGEALGSLCAVSSLSLTSKTAEESVSFTYVFDCHGNIESNQPSHLGQGTTISASNLFKNIPVRRQFYNTIKKKKEELKRIEDLLMAFGTIKPGVRLLFKNGKDSVWQKNGLPDTKTALLGIMGRTVVTQMEHKVVKCENPEMTMECYLPRPKCDVNQTSRSTNDRCFIAVNGRPVQIKEIEKCVKQYYCSCMHVEGRYPMCFIALNISTSDLDVNIDPNKTKVMLHEQKLILSQLEKLLEDIYGPLKDKKVQDIDKDNSLEDSFRTDDSLLNESDLSMDSRDVKVTYKTEGIRGTAFGHKFIFNGSKSNNNEDDCISSGLKISTHEHKVSDKSGVTVSDHEHIVPDESGVKTFMHEHLVPDVSGVKISMHEHLVTNENGVNISMHEHKISVEGENISKTSETNNVPETEKDIDESVPELCNRTGNETNKVSVSEYPPTTQGSFDILDDDFEDLLKSQHNNKALNNTLDDISFELLGDFGKDCKDVQSKRAEKENKNNEKSNESSANLMCTGACDIPGLNENRQDCETSNKHSEDIEKVTTDTSEVLKWSKGKSELGSDGRILQPVTLLVQNCSLTSNKRSHSDTFDDLSAFTPPPKRKSFTLQPNQPRLYDIVGKSPKEKYSLGFTAFSREERPKVIEDNPDQSYDDITKLVSQKWDKLSDCDKEQYEDSGKVQIDHLKKKVIERQRLSMKPSKKIEQSSNVKARMLSTYKPSSSVTPIQSVKVKFSVQRLREAYQSGVKQSQFDSDFKMSLIGALKFYNGWICLHGNKVKVINPHRVEETILSRELMENHVISSTKLETPLKLDTSVLGQTLLQVLVDMIPKESCQTYIYIEDKRITSNGFQIRCHLDENNCPILELDGVSKSIPTFGVQDLKEVAELIHKTSATCLQQCRPLKVIYYLQGEAVRMIRQRPLMRNKEDMTDILEQMLETLPQDCVQCLHDKPFLHTLYDMADIPVSQITQE